MRYDLACLSVLACVPSFAQELPAQLLNTAMTHAQMADQVDRFCYKNQLRVRWDQTQRLVQERWQIDINTELPEFNPVISEFGDAVSQLSRKTGGCHGPQIQRLRNDLHAEWSAAYHKLVLQP